MRKRFGAIFAIALGVLGVAGCIAATVVTWQLRGRVTQASDVAVLMVEESLDAGQAQLDRTKQRVESLRLSAESMREAASALIQRPFEEQVTQRVDLQERADRLAVGLNRAETLLELAESSVGNLQRAAQIGRSLGVPVDATAGDVAIKELAALRGKLTDITESLSGLRRSPSQGDAKETEDTTRGLAIKLVDVSRRSMLALGLIGPRIDSVAEKLDRIDERLHQAQASVRWWTTWAAFGVSLLMFWMALGQGALLYLGWHAYRRSPGSSGSAPL